MNKITPALVLAVGLIGTMLVVSLGNVFISLRCIDQLEVVAANLENPPEVICDSTAEVGVVLDIGLTLSGGLVGYLAGTARKEEEVNDG